MILEDKFQGIEFASDITTRGTCLGSSGMKSFGERVTRVFISLLRQLSHGGDDKRWGNEKTPLFTTLTQQTRHRGHCATVQSEEQ